MCLVDQLTITPDEVWADRGYDANANRDGLIQRGITPKISRRNHPGQGRQRDTHGRHRWQIERTNSWLASYRRLLIRWERRADLHLAFYRIAQSLICWRQLHRSL